MSTKHQEIIDLTKSLSSLASNESEDFSASKGHLKRVLRQMISYYSDKTNTENYFDETGKNWSRIKKSNFLQAYTDLVKGVSLDST